MLSVSLIISESNTCDTSHAHAIKRLCGIDYPLSHFKGRIVDHLGNPNLGARAVLGFYLKFNQRFWLTGKPPCELKCRNPPLVIDAMSLRAIDAAAV